MSLSDSNEFYRRQLFRELASLALEFEIPSRVVSDYIMTILEGDAQQLLDAQNQLAELRFNLND